MAVARSVLLHFSALFALSCSAVVPQPTVSLISPRGIRFEVPDRPGASLVAFHYNINNPLPGVKAGQYNTDVTKSPEGSFVHENRGVAVGANDTVYFWVHMVIDGLGYDIVEQQWRAGGASIQPVGGGDPQSSKRGSLRLVFEDTFGSLDPNKWDHEVSMYGGMNWEFQAYTPEPNNSYVRNDTLFLRPTLTADHFGKDFLREGVWDMKAEYGRCTNAANWGCLRKGRDALLNPAMSAKLSSKAHIKYGRVEVLAKMPKGDWLWPAIWMLPRHQKYGGWPRSGEIDIVETIGNTNYGGLGIWNMGSTLHWGVDGQSNRWQMTHKTLRAKGVSYGDGFHEYVLDWTRDHIQIFMDDRLVLNVPTPGESFFRWGNLPGPNIWATGDKNAPFDDDFYLILNVAVGGTNGIFPDGLKNEGGSPKPWRNTDSNGSENFWNASDQWYPTWKGEDAAMQVKYVRMWERPTGTTPRLQTAGAAAYLLLFCIACKRIGPASYAL